MKIVGYVLLVAALIAGTSALWYENQMRHIYSPPASTQFVIKTGETSAEILTDLHNKGLIDNYYAGLFFARSHSSLFVPGEFTLPTHYTIPTLLQYFRVEQHNEMRLTIPEGYTKEQIADELSKFNLSGASFLTLAKQSEGKLFPDTYNVDKKTTEADLFKKLTDNFQTKTSALTVSQNDLILASIVEREAKTDSERALIAGIYLNRLKNNMALEADPTVQYGKYTDIGPTPLKDGKKNYWAPILRADYTDVKSPYNTYLNRGLPPAPICNPGLKSIVASVTLEKTTAFYFFHTSSGQIITSRTLDEHNANKAKYLK